MKNVSCECMEWELLFFPPYLFFSHLTLREPLNDVASTTENERLAPSAPMYASQMSQGAARV